MAEEFDPLHKWLGIPPSQQPPNHYEVLGLSVFEENREVIDTAADRQTLHIRTFQTGKHALESQEVLNLIAQARVVLLGPGKDAYDRSLHENARDPGHVVSESIDSVPIDSVPIDGVPIDGVPIDGAPIDGAPVTDEPESLTSAPLIGSPAGKTPTWAWLVGGSAIIVVLAASFGLLRSFSGSNRNQDNQNEAQQLSNKAEQSDLAEGQAKSNVGSESNRRAHDKPATKSNSRQEESSSADSSTVTSPKQISRSYDFSDPVQIKDNWEFNVTFKHGAAGASAPVHPGAYLRTTKSFQGDVHIKMTFQMSRARFTNTGGIFLTVWGKRLKLNNKWHLFRSTVEVFVEGNSIVLINNGKEMRTPIDPAAARQPTKIEIRWRSRKSTFRKVEIKANRIE